MAMYSSLWAKTMWDWKNDIVQAIIQRGDADKYADLLLKFPTGWGHDTLRILRISNKELYDDIKTGITAREAVKWIAEIIFKAS